MELDKLSISSLNLSQLNEQVYDLLKEQILKGVFRPGQRLSTNAIAKHLGVSVTPVRDALQRLDIDGLVTVLSRRGTFVAEFTREVVQESFQSRRIIECAGAEELAKMPDQVIQRMEEIVDIEDSLRDGTRFTDFGTHTTLDIEFHQHIVDLLGNRRIAKFYEELYGPIQVTRELYYPNSVRAEETVVEHRAIVKAMKERDVGKLKRAILDHLDNVEVDLIRDVPVRNKPSNEP
jgi:DNA-binding GntR family transcriptional regulator